MEEEKPNLDDIGEPTTTRWKPTKEAEDLALTALKGILPTGLRATDKIFEEGYERARNLYKSGRYKEALPYFHILNLGNVKEPRYALAVGACYHMMKMYQEASSMYMLCGFLTTDDPIPFYHLADCHVKLGHPLPALACLNMALDRCKKPKFAALKDRIKMMMSRLDKELTAMKEAGFFLKTQQAGEAQSQK